MATFAGQLCEAIQNVDQLQGRFVAENLDRLDERERDEFDRYLGYCLSHGETVDSLAEAYLGMVDDIMGEQLHFARTGEYRYSKLDEVESKVYANRSYMSGYMRGVAVSLYLWPQHQDIKRFFHEKFPGRTEGCYLEVGPGHGMFFMHALQRKSFDRHLGIDISPTSIAATRSLLESGAFGSFDGYELLNADFLTCRPPDSVMACVAGEVLEHVERPDRFLEKFRECVRPGGFVFISTCVNAPVIDHIYNFDSVEGLEAIIAASGLDIEDRILIPHAGKTLRQCENKKLPLSMAYVLRKA